MECEDPKNFKVIEGSRVAYSSSLIQGVDHFWFHEEKKLVEAILDWVTNIPQ